MSKRIILTLPHDVGYIAVILTVYDPLQWCTDYTDGQDNSINGCYHI